MEKVVERPAFFTPSGNVEIWANTTTQNLGQLFQQYGYRLNRVAPLDGSEPFTGIVYAPGFYAQDADMAAAGSVRAYDATLTDYIELTEDGARGYLQTNNNSIRIAPQGTVVMQIYSIPQVDIQAGASLRIYDTTNADYLSISHTGANVSFQTAGVGGGAFQFTSDSDTTQFLSGMAVYIYDSANTSYVRILYSGQGYIVTNAGDLQLGPASGKVEIFSNVGATNSLYIFDADASHHIRIYHDGTDSNYVHTSSTDVNFSGASWYKFDADIRGLSGIQTIGGVSSTGINEQMAFLDVSGGIGRFGSYNWGTGAWQPLRVQGSDVYITSSGTHIYLEPATSDVIIEGAATNEARLYLRSNSDASNGLLLMQDANAAYLWNYENQDLVFATNNTTRMRIESSGHITLASGVYFDFDDETGDKIYYYGNNYTAGIESSTLYWESGGYMRWYVGNEKADGGTDNQMDLSNERLGLHDVGLRFDHVNWNTDSVHNIMYPHGGYYDEQTNNNDGALWVELPPDTFNAHTMMTIRLNGSIYNAGRHNIQIELGGYQYGTGNWTHCTARINGWWPGSVIVRFYSNTTDGQAAIMIGDTADTSHLDYPAFVVESVQMAYAGQDSAWDNDWDITRVTSLPTNFVLQQTVYPAVQQYNAQGGGRGYLELVGPTSYSQGDERGKLMEAYGDYGSVSVEGCAGTSGSYDGYAIRDDWVFMSADAAGCGIYNDTDNEWGIWIAQNSYVRLYYNGSARLETSSAGITVTGTGTATDWTATSDARLKSNLKLIDDALDKLDLINAYTYDKRGLIDRQAGIIAQEFVRALPEGVGVDESGMLTVSQSAFNAFILAAVKELKSQWQSQAPHQSE